MAHLQESIEVAVPVATAYGQWNDVESFPQFMGGVDSVTRIDDDTSHWVTHIGDTKREFDTRVVERRPNELIHWKSVGGTALEGTVVFEPVQGRGEALREALHTAAGREGRRADTEHTRVTVRMSWDDVTALEKMGAIVGADSREVKRDLKSFRDLVEGRRAGKVPSAPVAGRHAADHPDRP